MKRGLIALGWLSPLDEARCDVRRVGFLYGIRAHQRRSREDGGVPIIRDLRMPVGTVVTMVADGRTTEQILDDFPELETEHIKQALRFAAATLNERQVPLLPA